MVLYNENKGGGNKLKRKIKKTEKGRKTTKGSKIYKLLAQKVKNKMVENAKYTKTQTENLEKYVF